MAQGSWLFYFSEAHARSPARFREAFLAACYLTPDRGSKFRRAHDHAGEISDGLASALDARAARWLAIDPRAASRTRQTASLAKTKVKSLTNKPTPRSTSKAERAYNRLRRGGAAELVVRESLAEVGALAKYKFQISMPSRLAALRAKRDFPGRSAPDLDRDILLPLYDAIWSPLQREYRRVPDGEDPRNYLLPSKQDIYRSVAELACTLLPTHVFRGMTAEAVSARIRRARPTTEDGED